MSKNVFDDTATLYRRFDKSVSGIYLQEPAIAVTSVVKIFTNYVITG
jgi:hypothetical protein